jgi:hypothetical protein
MDGYAGYNRLLKPAHDISLAYCWAHARRKLVEILRTGPAPIAEDGVKRIGAFYRIEADIRGLDPAARLAARHERSAPSIGDFEAWLTKHRTRVARKSPSGEARCLHRQILGRPLPVSDRWTGRARQQHR